MTDPRLDEVALGVWEGLTERAIRSGWEQIVWGAAQGDWYFRSPGGERYGDVARHMADRLRSVGDPEDLVVIGHGISSPVLRAIYARLPREQAPNIDIDRDSVFRLKDGEITKISACTA